MHIDVQINLFQWLLHSLLYLAICTSKYVYVLVGRIIHI